MKDLPLLLVVLGVGGVALFAFARPAAADTAPAPAAAPPDPKSGSPGKDRGLGDVLTGALGDLLGAAAGGVGAAVGGAAQTLLSAEALEDEDSPVREGGRKIGKGFQKAASVFGLASDPDKRKRKRRKARQAVAADEADFERYERYAADAALLLQRDDVESWEIGADGSTRATLADGRVVRKELPKDPRLEADRELAKAVAVEAVARTTGLVMFSGKGPIKGTFAFNPGGAFSDENIYAPQGKKITNKLSAENAPEGVAYRAKELGRRLSGKRVTRGLTALGY